MPIKAKYNGSYKDITDLMNVDESIDYVLAKTSSSYKRVYTATRSIEDAPPTTFKSIKSGANLSDYRIYGQTSRNLFDIKTFAETCNQIYATVNYINNTLTFTATNVDAYVNAAYDKGLMIYDADRPSCIDVLPSTTYTISMSSAPKCYISWVNSSYEVVSAYTQIPANQKSYTFTTPSNCTKLLIRLGKEVTNIGDTFTISDIMLNTGSTALPYEPYGESVGDRTGNILPMSTVPISTDIDDFHCEYDGMGTITLTATKDNADFSSFTIPLKEDFIIPISVGQGGNGCSQFNNDKAYYDSNTSAFTLCFNFNNTLIDAWSLLAVNRIIYSYIEMGGRTINNISIEKPELVVLHLAKGDKLTIQPAFYNNGTTEQVPFEPYGYKVPVTVEGKNLLPNADWVEGYIARDGRIVEPSSSMQEITSPFVKVIPGKTYVFSYYPNEGEPWRAVIYYTEDKMFIKRQSVGNSASPVAFTVESGVGYVRFSYRSYGDGTFSQLELGDTVTDYEPYHAPVTTPIYLPEQIRKVGDEAEYVDYAEQKQHRVRKNYLQSSDFEAGAIFTGQGTKGLTYQGSKTPPGMVDPGGVVFDTTRKRSTDLITIIGTYTISIANGWEFAIVMFPDNKNSGVNMTYNTAPVTISNCTFAIQIKKSDSSDISSADISDYKIMLNKGSTPLPYEPYITNTELDVTLPALPTVTGTNTLSVGTEVQPSKIDITGHIKTISGGS